MIKANNELRMMCKGCGVPLWAVAEKLAVSENTLIRQWRKELSTDKKERIRTIIEQLKVGGRNE